MGSPHLLPAAHVHVDQLLAQYGSLIGWVIVALGIFYVVYGLRKYPSLRPFSRSLAHVALNVVASGLVLYLLFGFIQSNSLAIADLGFLAAHLIVIGMLTALVSGALVAFATQPDAAQRARRGFWVRRFAWGLFAGFLAGPIVGVLGELLLSGTHALAFASPGKGLLLLGDVFGIVAGWFIVAPVTGLVNVLRVRMDEQVARLPANALPSAGTVLALVGLVLTGFTPFSPATVHAMAHAIVLPFAGR